MIISLKVKNFYSIDEEQVLDLSVRDNKEENLGYCQSIDGKISKFSMIVGANASGKTNILKALSFLQWFISRPDLLVPNLPTSQFPFKSFFENENPTVFEIVFEVQKKIYTYFISLGKFRVLEEKLLVKQEVSVKTGTSLLFHRVYREEGKDYAVLVNKIEKLPTGVDIMQRGDIGIISIGSIFNIAQIVSLNDYWKNINTNVSAVGYVESFFPVDMVILNQNQELKHNIEKILKKFDVGLDELSMESVQTSPGSFLLKNVKEVHVFEGQRRENDIQEASHGTKRLTSILLRIIGAFENGTPVILDELDAYLHPAILEEIINMFFDEEINSKNAQLLFSSHSHAVMNKLDKYQIVISDKNTKGATEITRLDEFGVEVRNDDNFYKKYIAGIYGGVPNL